MHFGKLGVDNVIFENFEEKMIWEGLGSKMYFEKFGVISYFYEMFLWMMDLRVGFYGIVLADGLERPKGVEPSREFGF